MPRCYPFHTCSASRIWWSCAVLQIFPFHLYLFDLRPWASEPARLSKLRDLGFWSCLTLPVGLNPLSHFSSCASTCLHVHVHVHIRFHLIYLSHLSVFSHLSSRSNFPIYRFLTFLALASRLLLILGFDMEFFRSHKSLDCVISAWRRCLLLFLVVVLLTRFVHFSASLSSRFFFTTPLSLSCMLTTAFLRIYREIACRLTSTAVQCHPNRVHIHTRDRIRGQCCPRLRLLRWSRRDRVKNPTYIRRPRCLSRQSRIYRRSRGLVRVPEHGHVGAPLGTSPISAPVIPTSGGM